MRFYTNQHQFYCGIDLHARSMYLCVLDSESKVVLHRNYPARPDTLLKAIEPFRSDVVVGVECMFTWYWLADLCAEHGIPFILGHALYMKAIHGGKAKNDRVDARKLAGMMRGGLFPLAYVYPREMRATRDLLRRRMFMMRKRGDLLAHIQNTNSQYNLPAFEKNLSYRSNRTGVVERFSDDCVRKSMEVNTSLIDHYDQILQELENYLVRKAKIHDSSAFHRLRSVPGIGKIIALSILYEIHDIRRFPRVQNLISYARLVKCAKESGGKRLGSSGAKIGNAHLKWAFSEAAVNFLRKNEPGKKYHQRLVQRHGKGKALSILSAKLARAIYFMLSRGTAFDQKKFLA